MLVGQKMQKAKFTFNLIVIFLRRKIKLILALLFLILVPVALFIKLQTNITKPTLYEGIIGTYTEQDLPALVTRLTSNSLISIADNGLPKGELVSGWQVSEDGKTYTFQLKDNLYWTDGTKVKAQDLAVSLPDVQINTPNDQTLEFKIADSFSPFPTLLTTPILKKNTHTGVGPYKITSIQKDIIFVRKITLESEDKSLPDLVVRFYPNEKIAKNALKLGEIQVLLGVNDIADFQNQKAISTMSLPNYRQLVTIFYNTKDAILSDENFRIALSFAAPSIKNELEAITSIPPNSWAYNSQVRDYRDNPDQAKSYLSKVKNGRDSTITLTATSYLKDVGEKVVEEWKKNGINAVLRVESGVPQSFQALLIAQNIPVDPDQYSLWHSTQTQTNIAGYSSPRIDKDLEDSRKTTDMEIRKARYADFQKVILDHSPATFLYFPKYNIIYMNKVLSDFQKIQPLQLPSYE